MKYCEYAPRPLNIRLGTMYVGDEETSFYEIETRNGRLQLEGHLSSQNPSRTEKPEKKIFWFQCPLARTIKSFTIVIYDRNAIGQCYKTFYGHKL